jgi:enoyl-CoA hydratase/carnithine racemase
MSEPVITEFHNNVLTITLNSPETGNVVNLKSLNLIIKYIERANRDDECRVIVIKGRDGVFSRGMDFNFMLEQAEDGIDLNFSRPYKDAVLAIRNSKKVTIAAIDGDVLAGGMGLVLACDIVISTSRSIFGLSEVLFGIIPAYVFPLLLERVTLKTARFIVLSSEKFGAGDALRYGIVDDIAGDDNLEKAVVFYIKRLLASSPDALALVKTYSDYIYKTGFDSMDDAMVAAGKTLTELLKDNDVTSAIKHFMEGDKMPWAVRYRKKK